MKLNAGMIIGIAGAAIGGSVGIAVAFMSEPIMGFVIAGVMCFVFFIMYRAFIKPSMDYSRLQKNGIQATGTILSISETGTRINNQPLCKIELQVELPGKPAYITITKTVISYFQASQFQPGTKVPLFVDPVDNQKVAMVRQGDLPGGKGATNLKNASPENIAALKEKLEELQKANELIKATGIYSKAIVTKFTNMGVMVNGNNPLATIEVQVLPDNEPAFGATVKGAIKDTSVPLFQPGEEIFVRYDPNDKTKVTIEHS